MDIQIIERCVCIMINIAKLSNDDRLVLFTQTGAKRGLHPSIVEKDFWVCFMLDHLFHDCKYRDSFVFKGGTSLSKAYHVIERFSEDIDLILDWRKIINDDSNPWENRSKNKQDLYNKKINKLAASFYLEELVPILNKELIAKLGEGQWVSVDSFDDMVINFNYPKEFNLDYIVPVIRLEIGPLAAWMPSHKVKIKPFVAEEYPNIFTQSDTEILTIDVERTFWEKITILHKIANYPVNKLIPRRYARHLYDVYCMANSEIRNNAFDKKVLLEQDVLFKMKFYYSKNANYENATTKKVQLIPSEIIINELRKDYDAMSNMIYGIYPSFDEIINCLKKLQEEIHNL